MMAKGKNYNPRYGPRKDIIQILAAGRPRFRKITKNYRSIRQYKLAEKFLGHLKLLLTKEKKL